MMTDDDLHASIRIVERNKFHGFNFAPSLAPFDVPLRSIARDSQGDYLLPFSCIRTKDNGWINANTRARLNLTIAGWAE